MTEEATAAPAANPYNAKQTPVGVPRGITSADDGLAPPRQPEVVQEATPNADVPPVEEPQKFNKVDYKKRYDDLKRHYDTKVNEFKSKEQLLREEAKEARPKYTPPRTPEELATFKDEYSDLYDTIKTVAYSESQEQLKEVQERVAGMEIREADVAKREAFADLSKLQPEFEEIKSTEAFHVWVDEQPQDIQDWLYKSFNAELASRAIDLFKQDVGWKSEKVAEKRKPGRPKKKPSAADAVSITSSPDLTANEPKVWTTSEIDYLASHNPIEAEKLMSEWDKAFKEGRVVKG